VGNFLSQGADKLYEVADKVYGLADDVESGDLDIESIVTDVQRFARRRPAVFLLTAAVAGFGVGRVVRSSTADGDTADGGYDVSGMESDEFATTGAP
jgi:hypothetical protein